ncbi:hypothetical protein BLNAU_22814 [Blattamonas nauphoetae]|uniref:Uncharacterized protein n=1 Tax=Blattamonas nauphoetae TaxID=2049346 RepID=A0ABQ9WS21_9EUKA|nr:hypothetical protein BLNAU_22814 [Blattamonas nauphoetae]
MSFTKVHPPSDLPLQPSPPPSTHTLIFLFEVGSDILISVGIVWPFAERIIVRMNALSHIAVHNVIPLPSRPNCAEQVLTEALDPLEMLHKAFLVANHQPNSADMLATCFALQCCHAGSIKGIGTTSDAASQANPNSASLNLENRHTLSTRNECAMSERPVARSVAGQWSASCVSWLDGSGSSVDDVKVAVGLVEGSFGCWEAGDGHRATPHPRQPASPASPHGTASTGG